VTVGLFEIGAGIAMILLGAASVLVKSARDGRIAEWREARKRAKTLGDDAHAKVMEKADKLDKLDKLDGIEEQVEENGEQLKDVGEAIVVLHQEDEDVDEEALRRKVDVEDMSGDIVESDD